MYWQDSVKIFTLKFVFKFYPVYVVYEYMFCSLIGDVDGCNDDGDMNSPRCPRSSPLVMIFFLIYILMTSIMLINLLIAIFRLCFSILLAFLIRRRQLKTSQLYLALFSETGNSNLSTVDLV